jgi:hypothetical protein
MLNPKLRAYQTTFCVSVVAILSVVACSNKPVGIQANGSSSSSGYFVSSSGYVIPGTSSGEYTSSGSSGGKDGGTSSGATSSSSSGDVVCARLFRKIPKIAAPAARVVCSVRYACKASVVRPRAIRQTPFVARLA